MFEPLTQTVSQLAGRWKCSVQDVLTHAMERNWPVYFQFDGLVFDVNDRKNRSGGYDRKIEEAAWLEKTIAQAEATLTRNALRAQGKLEMTQWEEVLSEDAMCALRKAADENKALLRAQRESIQAWHEGRQRFHRNGALRAAPRTLQDVAERGSASFPIKAYHPDSPAWLVPDPYGPGQLLEGRMVALEDMGPHPKEKLTADDLFASMIDIKTIEAANSAREVGRGDTTTAETKAAPVAEAAYRTGVQTVLPPPAKRGITTAEAVHAFDGLVAINLKSALDDAKKWVEHARLSPGRPGGRHKNLWCPVLLAICLYEMQNVKKRQLNNAFHDHDFLDDWREEWRIQAKDLV